MKIEDEMRTLLAKTAEGISEEYYNQFLDVFIEATHESEPLAVWQGIAQALADASAYRVVLQGAIMAPAAENRLVIAEWRDVSSAEPTTFVKSVN